MNFPKYSVGRYCPSLYQFFTYIIWIKSHLIQANLWGIAIDKNNVIAAGHSYGGITAQSSGGAKTYSRDNLNKIIYEPDNRFKGILAISPPGFISVSGFGISEFFFKNMLDELGIKINLFRVGEYKGAAETYVRTDFSDENEEQYLNLLNYRMTNYLDRISFSRGMEKDKLLSIINNFETELPKDALNNKLIDSLIYEDEMSNYLKIKVDSSYKKISLLKYINCGKNMSIVD